MQIMHSFSSLIAPKSSSEYYTREIDYMIRLVSAYAARDLPNLRHEMKTRSEIRIE
jgi:hypothetical protein